MTMEELNNRKVAMYFIPLLIKSDLVDHVKIFVCS